MEIRHLKLIKAVAETGTLTKAGKQLFLSQSALSHQLKEIEKYYQAQVFTRINKNMQLTEVGSRLLETALKVLDEIERTSRDIEKLISGENAVVRVSTHCYTFYHWLSKSLIAYRGLYPNGEIQVVTQAVQNTLEWLEKGELDIAIVNFLPENTRFNIYEIFEDELVVLMSPKNSSASKKYINPQDLMNETYITYKLADTKLGKTYEQVFLDNKVNPAAVIQLELTEAIVEMVKANQGISILAKWSLIPHQDDNDLVILPLTKKGTLRKWYAVTLPYKDLPQSVNSFIEIMRQLKSKSDI